AHAGPGWGDRRRHLPRPRAPRRELHRLRAGGWHVRRRTAAHAERLAARRLEHDDARWRRGRHRLGAAGAARVLRRLLRARGVAIQAAVRVSGPTRRVWALAGKDLLETRRDRLALLFTVIMPLAFTVFFGSLFGGGTDRLPLALWNGDSGPAAR